jgi:prevent-host-death family protein
MMQVNIFEAKNRLSQLIKSAQLGEEVIIANRGEPAVRLVPTEKIRSSANGEKFLEWLDLHPIPTHLMTNHQDIEAGILAERSAWD